MAERNRWGIEVGMGRYLKPDMFCDSNAKNVSRIVSSLINQDTSFLNAIQTIYHFVKNNIWFCGPPGTLNPASKTLSAGKGCANSKSALLVSMFRNLGIPAYFQAFLISGIVFSEYIPDYLKNYKEKYYLHLRPLVRIGKKWVSVEGVIPDDKFLETMIKKYSLSHPAKGIGISTESSLSKLNARLSSWDGENETFCMDSSVTTSLGEVIDVSNLYLKYRKNSIVSRIVSSMIEKKMEAIRTSL
ncbi:MAG: transglutaminase family protein [Caldisericia bacterium]